MDDSVLLAKLNELTTAVHSVQARLDALDKSPPTLPHSPQQHHQHHGEETKKRNGAPQKFRALPLPKLIVVEVAEASTQTDYTIQAQQQQQQQDLSMTPAAAVSSATPSNIVASSTSNKPSKKLSSGHWLTELPHIDLHSLTNESELQNERFGGLQVQLYSIDLRAGPWRWRIHRIIPDFVKLHFRLKSDVLRKEIEYLPSFPKFEYLREKDNQIKNRHLYNYLKALLQIPQLRDNSHVAEFLEVSSVSFNPELGPKFTETSVDIITPWFRFWKRKFDVWLVIKSSCLFLLKKSMDGDYIRHCLDVILFAKGIEFKVKRKYLRITSGGNSLKIKVRAERSLVQLHRELTDIVHKGEWNRPHQYDSWVPQRRNCRAKWYVDGQSYFEDLALAIESAVEEVYITDWWLSPEVYLLRPAAEYPQYRLDRLLQKKASQGVKIFVILFKEMALAVSTDSLYSKTILTGLHPNIAVVRSPDENMFLWSHHEKIVVIDRGVGGAFIGGIDLCFGRYDSNKHRLADANPSRIMWTGKDYANSRLRDYCNLNQPGVDLIDRFDTPRMGWHDIQAYVQGEIAMDVSRHFIQRWNNIKRKGKIKNMAFLIPKDPKVLQREIRKRFGSESNMGSSPCECQMLRSVSRWSAGCDTESSIHAAYIHLISQANHFIYIENQFFISSTAGDIVTNEIGNTLVARILKAYEEDKSRNDGQISFHVVIVIPLLPDFAGEVATTASLKAVMHWQFATMARNKTSLLQRLGEKIPNPLEYIRFFSLRNYDELPDGVHTEQIYVHSKMMVVDDIVTIIGSANINDRSMLGDRDSEVAVVFNESEFVDSKMGGKDYRAGVFSRSLRMHCFQEHLGLKDDERHLAEDPIACYENLWLPTAMKNTEIFAEVFNCIPDNKIISLGQLPDQPCVTRGDLKRTSSISEHLQLSPYLPEELSSLPLSAYDTAAGMPISPSEAIDVPMSMDRIDSAMSFELATKPLQNVHRMVTIEEAQHELSLVKGHIVVFPMEFLSKEYLQPRVGSAELLVPPICFT